MPRLMNDSVPTSPRSTSLVPTSRGRHCLGELRASKAQTSLSWVLNRHTTIRLFWIAGLRCTTGTTAWIFRCHERTLRSSGTPPSGMMSLLHQEAVPSLVLLHLSEAFLVWMTYDELLPKAISAWALEAAELVKAPRSLLKESTGPCLWTVAST